MMDRMEDDHQAEIEHVIQAFQVKKQLQEQHLKEIEKKRNEAMEEQFAASSRAIEEHMLDDSFESLVVSSVPDADRKSVV